MGYHPPSLVSLIENLSRLPGIGRKTAARLALFIMRQPEDKVQALARSILDIKEKIQLCSRCHNFTEQDPCPLCRNQERATGVICVVESPGDLMALEATGVFRGRYHVLGGVLSPLNGIGPDNLNVKELLARLESEEVREVLLATGSSVEGEATANYLADLLRDKGVRITRIAQGMPLGSDLEYVDEATLKKAVNNRQEA
ncbi:MAG: recombination protein RecR [Deltaproteobacteria bacterium]|nr:recombination protein RecR [Deltaproteobacteria bacterium]MBW2141585.1 recombination protein RecR [Deltaproteobacteria bacterium]